jgi:D-alanyl-D-alanine carboxypeptidase
VDTVTDPATPVAPPAPRAAEEAVAEPALKTEPNRDPADGAVEAPESDGSDDTDEDAAESANPEDVDDPEGSAEAESAPGHTPVAEGGARSGDGRASEASPSDTDPDATAQGAAAAENVGAEKETAVENEAAAEKEAPPAPAKPADKPVAKPVVKPLVSDLPEERPGGAQSGRLTAFRGPVAFGTPGAPTKARTGPQAPAPGAHPGVRPSGKPDARPSTPPPPPASRPAVQAPVPLPPAAKPQESQEGEIVGPEGTRGMPVPPAPPQAPIKLLAELTNTPPPAETALRTVTRRFKIWTPLVVLLALVFVLVQALRPLPSDGLDLTVSSSYTFQGAALAQSMPWPAEGQSVAEVEGLGSLGVHGAQTRVPIASLTKVMTAYVILHDHPLTGQANGPMIEVDAQAAQEVGSGDQSTAPVKKGQRFTERQMLQLLLVPSGNNIARLLARWDSGTQEAFVAKMTKAAAGLGMTNTTYTGASGIEETTVSTAVDQLKLAREVMKSEVFRSVVALPNIQIPGVGKIYNNNNDLVKFGVVGIKTGSSTPAGGALMWAAHQTVGGKQQLILGVMLQQHGGTTVDDSLQTALTRSQALIDSVQGGLTTATVVKKGDVVGEIDDKLGGSTPVVADKDLTAIGWPGMKSGITLTPVGGGLPHNAKAGTKVGTLSFGTGSARTTVPVVLQSDLHAPPFGAKLTRVS